VKTRYFVIASALVLVVGIGTGMVAYYVGVPQLGVGRTGPAELRYVPADAAVVAYADVHTLMGSEIRQRIRQAMPGQENGQREFKDQTGIDIEHDVDRVVACLEPTPGGAGEGRGLVLARGRFDTARLESLMRDHGATIDTYKGKQLIIEAPPVPAGRVNGGETFAVLFIEPGLAAVGSEALVRRAVDLQGGSGSITTNDELMNLLRGVDDGTRTMWAVGRFDALAQGHELPPQIASQLPAITWFSVSGRVDSAVSASIRADTRDDAAAKNLRDVVQGFIGLARLQASARPEFKAALDSVQLGGTGKTVTLSFTVPPSAFDLLPNQASQPRAH